MWYHHLIWHISKDRDLPFLHYPWQSHYVYTVADEYNHSLPFFFFFFFCSACAFIEFLTILYFFDYRFGLYHFALLIHFYNFLFLMFTLLAFFTYVASRHTHAQGCFSICPLKLFCKSHRFVSWLAFHTVMKCFKWLLQWFLTFFFCYILWGDLIYSWF